MVNDAKTLKEALTDDETIVELDGVTPDFDAEIKRLSLLEVAARGLDAQLMLVSLSMLAHGIIPFGVFDIAGTPFTIGSCGCGKHLFCTMIDASSIVIDV